MMNAAVEPTRVFHLARLLLEGYQVAIGEREATWKLSPEASHRNATLLHMHHFPCAKCATIPPEKLSSSL